MADTIQGLSIGLNLDSTGLDRGLKNAKQSVKMMNSEMAANMSAFDRSERSMNKYQTQLGGLNRKLDAQKVAVGAARTEYDKMVAKHGEGSTQANRAATAYNNEVAAVNNLERHVESLTQEMQQFQAQQDASNSAFGRMSTALTSAGENMTKLGTGMKNAGKSLSMYVTAPIVGFGAAAAKVGVDFDDSMAKVQAVSGATGSELDTLRTLAKDMGATTKFSASEAADGLNYMAMAGWKTEQMVGGLPGIMSLAAASGEDLATVSDIVTDALTAFGLKAEDSGRFADVLASASSNANTNVSMLGASFKYVAPVAGALGMSVEDSALALGLMANAGIKADQSGTALRTMLTNLAKPTKQMQKHMDKLGISLTNQDGSMKTLDEVMINLRESFTGLTKDQQAASAAAIFGKEAMSGALSIINASEADYNKLGDAINNSTGKAEEMAKTMEGQLGGTLRTIKSGLEGFAISIYEEMLPSLSKGAEKVQGFVSWLNGLSPAAKKGALAFGAVAAAIGPLLVVGGTLIAGLGSILTFVGSVSGAIAIMGTGVAASTPLIGALATAFTVLTGPVGIAVAAIAGIGVGVGLLVNHLKKDAIPEVDRFGDGVSESTQKALGGFFKLSDGASQELSTMSITSQEITGEMANNLVGKFAEMNTQILDGMKKRHADELKEMETQFLNSSALTAEREEEILRQEKIRNEMEVVEQEHFQSRIKEIMDAAASEKRELTEIEKETINSIQEEMNKNAVQYLTDNERDQKIILENMKNQADELSAQQAAAVVKNSAKQRDEVIADADKTYNDTIAFAIQQRDEAGTISADEAQKIIDEAKKKRDTTVGHAKSMHQEVVGEAQKQAVGHVEKVDWETGEILSKWDVYKNGVVSKFKATNKESMDDFKRWGSEFNTNWNSFNDKAQVVADKYKAGVKKKFLETTSESLADFKRWGSDFDTGWTNFNNKAKEKVDGYKANVVRKFKETSTESLADFKRWGGNLKDWATDAKDKVSATFDKMVEGAKNLPERIGRGISSMAFKITDGTRSISNKLVSGLGTGVNGLIGGLNWVLGKIGSDSRVPKWEVPKYAHGTKGHPGGLAILGDGRGSNAGRELIQTPSGELSLSPVKDTLMNLPKGSQVLSAKKTKELLGDIPKYANGIGNMLGDLWNGAKGLGKKAVSAAFDVWDYVKNPSKLLNVALGALGISAPVGGSLAGNMAKAGYNKVKTNAIDFVKKKLADFEATAPMAGSGNGFGSPFRLTSRRGMRMHPVTRKWTMHQGDDWGAPAGTLIPAQAAGRVVQSGFHNIRGNYVRVKSGIMERIYQHNTKNLVGVGQNVRKGQAVGTVGSTGRSTGPHLHYEVKKNGVNINPFGLATGGVTTGLTASTLHEEGYPEIVIPTAPKRRTDAMKLLAIAGKKIMGNDSSVIRPNQLPNAGSQGSEEKGILKQLLQATMQQNQLLMQLLNKNGDVYLDGDALVGAIGPDLEQWNGGNTAIKMTQKGWG